MKDNILLNTLPKPLIEDIIKGQCIPIIGAGFSLNANNSQGKRMPLWNELGELFASQMNGISYNNPIDAISAYSYAYSRAKLIEKLREWLLIDSTNPGYTHQSFARVQFKTIITTNFDFLIERSFDIVNRPYHLIVDENQLSINNEYTTIVKLHGDLNHPNNLIATEEDYDMFLYRYPLLATFISNLLISKTPLFIGYSLEDTDFRQIWQIISNRLGHMRRAAYIITLEASDVEITRYDRRGVKVINLPGKKINYGNILGDLFNQITDYWSNTIAKTSTITRAESLEELALPADSNSGLVFFSITSNLISYYKTYIFPIFEKYGFKPVLADDIISVGDTVLAKITALIERSLFVVVDNSNSSWIMHETKLALEYKKEIIFIVENNLTFDDIDGAVILRPNINEIHELQNFIETLEKEVNVLSIKYMNALANEPYRLLEKGEFKAAVISVISLLEVELKKRLKNMTFNYGLNRLVSYSIENGLIPVESEKKIIEAIKTRNKLVHTDYSINQKLAKKMVNEIMEILKKYLLEEL